ncbi:DUF21-domain-containing protein [Atractiella rhizophila]|nr:DUF21-domain-containing protein [Atractiella rhizophila]
MSSRHLLRPLFLLTICVLLFLSLSHLPGARVRRDIHDLAEPISGQPPETPPGRGVFAGLTLGLMGLDQTNLKVLSQAAEGKERTQAVKVLKLLEKGRHWVLVVLLLSNVIVNESLPIFLDSILGGGIAAIAISTTMIVIFGEIIPQSVSVRYGLSIGSKAAPFVLILMYITAPISWPIAKLLDWILGHDEGTTYKKAELKTFVSLHGNIGDESLNEDEITIIGSVLELAEKSVDKIMTPIADCYTLGADDILDEETVTEILSQGYSRVPIHEAGHPENFIGMLLIKQLITYDPEDARPVKSFKISSLPETEPSVSCLDALNFFQTGKSHMLLVSKNPGEDGGALGIVSLEDVIEEMIGEEIVDETDVYVDVHNKIKVIRRPAIKSAAAGQLGPFIKGIMERRRNTKVVRQNSNYGTLENGIVAPKPILDKVRMKADPNEIANRSPSTHPRLTVEDALNLSQSPDGFHATERSPLLTRSRSPSPERASKK